MRFVLALGLIAATVLVGTDADAKCAYPGPLFSPVSGAVPPTPTVRLFAPPSALPKTGLPPIEARDAAGKPLAIHVSLEAAMPAFSAFAIAVPKKTSGSFTVTLTRPNGTVDTASYTVDPSWKAKAPASTAIVTSRVSKSWTCSHQLTTNLAFDDVAPAYRVVLASKKSDLDKPIATSIVLPSDPLALFGSQTPSSGRANLALGYVNCMGETFDWKGSGRWARVRALFPDGSEADVGSPLWLPAP